MEQLVPEQTLVLLSRYFNDMSKMWLGELRRSTPQHGTPWTPIGPGTHGDSRCHQEEQVDLIEK